MPKRLFLALVLYKPVQYKKQKYITGLLLSHPEKCLSVMFQMGPTVGRGKMERASEDERNKF